jgi:DNA primase
MQNLIQQVLLSHLPSKRKQTASGWVSFNAVCCTHRGESIDKRQRGGAIATARGGITYHCFNCHFKAGWQPGWVLSPNFKELLTWLNVSTENINELRLETIRLKQGLPSEYKRHIELPKFEARALPEQTRTFEEMVIWHELAGTIPHDFFQVADYVLERKIDPVAYGLSWSDADSFARRVIVPMIYQNVTVGYTARSIDRKDKLKYFSSQPANFVFNMDRQGHDRVFAILCEGPFDAMSVDGISIMGSNLSEGQARLINTLQRQIIVVPDNDKAGAALVDAALEQQWSVSFPDWWETCKDVNEATIKYGKLFAFKNILDRTETNPVKIELMRKKYFKT